MRDIYERAGAPFTPQTQEAIATWEHDNPQHSQGAFNYDLAEFGLGDADIDRTFADYILRFSPLI